MTGIKKERNVLIDVVKAFAIISVVIGHGIQYGFSADYLRSGAYFDNVLFKIIYSYHMPLFMLISGYLFAYSINRDWKSVIIKEIVESVGACICLGGSEVGKIYHMADSK